MSSSSVYHIFPYGVALAAAVVLAIVGITAWRSIATTLGLISAGSGCAVVAWLLQHEMSHGNSTTGWLLVAILLVAAIGWLGQRAYRGESRTCWVIWAVAAVYLEHALGYASLPTHTHQLFPLLVAGLLLMTASRFPERAEVVR